MRKTQIPIGFNRKGKIITIDASPSRRVVVLGVKGKGMDYHVSNLLKRVGQDFLFSNPYNLVGCDEMENR